MALEEGQGPGGGGAALEGHSNTVFFQLSVSSLSPGSYVVTRDRRSTAPTTRRTGRKPHEFQAGSDQAKHEERPKLHVMDEQHGEDIRLKTRNICSSSPARSRRRYSRRGFKRGSGKPQLRWLPKASTKWTWSRQPGPMPVESYEACSVADRGSPPVCASSGDKLTP